ncbi:MAG: 16S rRNA (uracil(1498)-N(3))-methyltransferase [Desulfobacterales bacterium]|nr:16S rRNA (uracil(1498)-N(3))-methyltransferase [Desulfobacterales bacterium]
MRRFVLDKLTSDKTGARLTGSDANHIKNVLRLKPGEIIRLIDGSGLEYEGRITNITAESVAIAITSESRPDTEPEVHVTIAQAYLKDKKMDTLVRQLTELGISRWAPFFAERSVAKPDSKKLSARKERWEKIARESIKQCGRTKTPEIMKAVSFDDAMEMSNESTLKIVFWENEAVLLNQSSLKTEKDIKTIFFLLGPEGGFTNEEIEKAKTNGFVSVSIGPRILKADTATIAACSIIQYVYGDMG